MPHRRRRIVAALALLLGGSLFCPGCDSLPHLPFMARRAEPEATPPTASVGWRQRITAPPHHSATTSAEVLQPQSVVYWSALPAGGPGGGHN